MVTIEQMSQVIPYWMLLLEILGLFILLVGMVYLSVKDSNKYEQDQKDFRVVIPLRIDAEILRLTELKDSVRYSYNADNFRANIDKIIHELKEEKRSLL